MINISVLDVAKAVGGVLIGNPNAYINGVSCDSRTCKPNNLYIPLIGENNDGHDFIKDVALKKASCILVQKDHKRPSNIGIIPYIIVQDTTRALQSLASYYIKKINPYVIGVTGSNGKTSAKDMLCEIMSYKYKTAKTFGNHNNEIGVPLSILDFDNDIECAIIEMGVEHKGDIDFLSKIVKPNVALITSLGSAHLANFENKKGLAGAKLEIYSNLTSGGYMFYNGESLELDKGLDNIIDNNKEAYPFGDKNDLCIVGDVRYEDDYTRFRCSLLENEVAIKALGKHQATNALGCIGIGLKEGISEKDILSALRHVSFADKRCNLIKVKDSYIIDDSYKSNPESARAAIDTLKEFKGYRKIACLGDMLDLGEKAAKYHKQLGDYIVDCGFVDKVICYGDLSEYIADETDGEFYKTKEECINYLSRYINRRSVILIKGSRAMEMDLIVKALVEGK